MPRDSKTVCALTCRQCRRPLNSHIMQDYSARMRKVRQSQTDIENLVAAELRSKGIRYRRNVRSLPGSPDFANKSRRWAIFVNGCFWHRHTNCRRATLPKTNQEFWINKFGANRARDARKICELRKLGFSVLLLWGCEVLDGSYVKSLKRVE